MQDLKEILQIDFNVIQVWFKENHLLLNVNKL